MTNETCDELLVVFRDEATDLVERLRRTLEPCFGGEPLARPAIDEALRLAHSLKGAAGSVGETGIVTMSHALEDVLAVLERREGAERIGPAVPAFLLDMERLVEGDAPAEDPAERAAELRAASGVSPSAEPLAAAGGLVLFDEPLAGEVAPADVGAPRADVPREGEGTTARPRTVRIETSRLDELLGHAAELVAMRGRMLGRAERSMRVYEDLVDATRTLPGDARERFAALVDELRRVADADRAEAITLGRVTSGLEGAMRAVRLVPLSAAVPKWRRTVAEVARTLGKDVRLTMDVGTVEIDKDVLERLHDPLVHLLRNAVDHGIEAHDERQRAGKAAQGQLRIAARLDAGLLRLEVQDDGRGCDLERIREVALRRGLRDPSSAARMSEDETLALLFETGFSTASRVSAVSGRGVGLDVVQRAVTDLGGRVWVEGRGPGRGTTFVMSVPSRRLATRGLVVVAGSQPYVFPVDGVERTRSSDARELRRVDGRWALGDGRGEPLPVASLDELLGGAPSIPRGRLKIVVVGRASRRFALIVDDVLREEEVVLRPLPWNLENVPGVAGAVILAEGTVALALDVPRLGELALPHDVESRAVRSDGPPASRRVLVVDDSLTSRTLRRNGLVAAGYDVVVAVDGEEAWELLGKSAFDAIVTDVQMPRLDGFGLTERVRADGRLRATPVVLVTSLSSPDDVARGKAAGADVYLVKGQFEQDDLLREVARLLARTVSP